jgi:hypothetical protein
MIPQQSLMHLTPTIFASPNQVNSFNHTQLMHIHVLTFQMKVKLVETIKKMPAKL